MARTSTKSNRIIKSKVNAPKIPPNTCPYIDFVISCIEDDFDAKDDCDTKRKAALVEALEYIRSANETLRFSSKYWYDEYKKVA